MEVNGAVYIFCWRLMIEIETVDFDVSDSVAVVWLGQPGGVWRVQQQKTHFLQISREVSVLPSSSTLTTGQWL